ncbi:glycoprotein-N-acetylgalactosamine 3-beta-galactosyltransferase 1-like [Sycon ciliatum]|uniref:glycoprotein-N-acetylgalactosamine 3-beta-galactosyltransferase 1-like n=1 Tax=Sycon ciliatum TaxID=27933 RepID=UPI0031F6998E
MTGSSTIARKGPAILATWGRRCDRLLFMTSGEDRTNLSGRVSLPGVTEGRPALVAKSREAWKYVHEKYRWSYDWFYKCDDDTYTVVENLKFMLYTTNTTQPRYLGKHLQSGGIEWLSGGAGYVLNRAALGKLNEQIGKGCMTNARIENEDMLVSICLKSAGVAISDSRDAARSRFLPLSPELHLTPGAVASSAYKWVLQYSGMAVGQRKSVDPVQLGGNSRIDMVDGFRYLGSVLSADGTVDADLAARLAYASRPFGVLWSPIFQCVHLSVHTKRLVYRAIVLSALLYGAETWPIKVGHIHRFNTFHQQCIRTILGISRREQWEERLSSASLSELAEVEERLPSASLSELAGVDADMADVIMK